MSHPRSDAVRAQKNKKKHKNVPSFAFQNPLSPEQVHHHNAAILIIKPMIPSHGNTAVRIFAVRSSGTGLGWEGASPLKLHSFEFSSTMSRTYRPRLSKDKAVAQRVGEELERQRQEEFSVARQLAAIKVLEQGNEATSCSNSTKPTTVVQQAQVRVSSNALTPSLERRHVGSISSGRSREEPARSESQASVLTSAAPASTSNGRTANARRRAASASPSPAENRNGGIDWSCLSCSLLNPITSTVCSMCRTKNYQQASVGRGTGKGRGARARGEIWQ